jgi:hypothetical protein
MLMQALPVLRIVGSGHQRPAEEEGKMVQLGQAVISTWAPLSWASRTQIRAAVSALRPLGAKADRSVFDQPNRPASLLINGFLRRTAPSGHTSWQQ